MKITSILLLCFCFAIQLSAQVPTSSSEKKSNKKDYRPFFETAYQLYPDIPRGILEAVAYTHTHMRHIRPQEEASSCMGLPAVYGLMGLVEDGEGYFKNNLSYIATRTSYTAAQLKNSAAHQILAYAEVYQQCLRKFEITEPSIAAQIPVLLFLSELPSTTTSANVLHDNFALQTQLYGILDFLNQSSFQQQYNFPAHQIDLEAIFGVQNYRVLSAPHILLKDASIETSTGEQFDEQQILSPDYPPAIWDAAATCNYSSRNGVAVSAVTIHTIQGSYAGAISWFKNCAASVSAHYIIRSSDGQVTQMVLESDKAWHVGSENPYTIGFEHEGFVDDASWYTQEMYESSADIVKDIVTSGYNINPLRAYHGNACGGSSSSCQLGGCIKIKGHQHYANQTHTDPGLNWDWVKFYNLINQNTPITTVQTETGTSCDSGGTFANYGDDERTLFRISIPEALAITLNFSSFDLEENWDYLTIYEGASVNAPIVGTYTGTDGPPQMTIYSEHVLVEFRSDCATTNPGYCFSWEAQVEDIIIPTTVIGAIANPVTEDFMLNFMDTDNQGGSGINDQYFLVTDFDGTAWRSNHEVGFYYDEFSNTLHQDWTVYSGTWSILNDELVQSDANDGNSNIYTAVNQNLAEEYLYQWKGKISGSGNNQRAGIHFFCDNAHTDNRNNSYFMYFRESSNLLQLYKVVEDTWTLEVDVPYTFNLNQFYDFKLFFNKNTGFIDLYVDDILALSWIDEQPHTTGNYISFRNGNCIYTIDDFKVWKGRTNAALITVGEAATNMIRYSSPDEHTPVGSIRSIVRDYAANISTEVISLFQVDLSPPLSIEWLDFKAVGQQAAIQLEWKVAPNDDLATFILERSVDANAFEAITQVTAKNFISKYQYTDKDIQTKQFYYYRLKVIKQDASASYSSVVSSQIQGEKTIVQVYPNPAREMLNIRLREDIQQYESLSFALFDVSGQELRQQKLTHSTISFDLKNLPKALYIGVLTDASQTVLYQEKIVIH